MTTTAIFPGLLEPRPARGDFAPLARSAFRALGLPATASQREVHGAATRLRLALKIGVTREFDEDLAWLAPLGRDESAIRDALSRLDSPHERARERLFWFHGRADLPAAETVRELEAGVERLLSADDPAARHDAALLALAGLYRLDPMFAEPESWARAFRLWREVCDAEEFWSSLVAADLKGDFEPAVTFGEVAALRATSQRLACAPAAERAKTDALRGRAEPSARALRVLRAASLPEPLLAEYEDEIVGPFEDRLDEPLADAFAGAETFRNSALTDLFKRGVYSRGLTSLERDLKPLLAELLEVAGGEHHSVRRVFGETARRLEEFAVCWREVGAGEHERELLKLAHALAPPAADDPQTNGETPPESESESAARSAEARSAYEVAALCELRREMPDWLVEERFTATAPASSWKSSAGYIALVFFYFFVFASCFVSEKCGGAKFSGGRRSSPIDALQNFNMPMPRYTPPELPAVTQFRITKRVSVAELRGLIKRGRVVVVDVRDRAAYDAGHIPGAVWLPEDAVEENYRTVLRRGRRVVFYCNCPGEAAAERVAGRVWLRGEMDVDVAVLEGGYRAWLESEGRAKATPAATTKGRSAAPSGEGSNAPEPPLPLTTQRER